MKSSTNSDPPPLFIDTWAWLALADASEPYHEELTAIRAQYNSVRSRWVTTDYVLDETITRLFSKGPFRSAEGFSSLLFEARDLGSLRVEPITAGRFESAFGLRRKYHDKPRISFTDLTSFVVMQELGISHALTRDAHFRQAGLGFVTLP